jgi:uncharacterized protein YbbC (DUF1343 family)
VIRTGLDVFCDNPTVSGKVGLLTNVASQTPDGKTALAALRGAGVQVAALFGPEHGYFSHGAEGELIADTAFGDIAIHSLYNFSKGPARETLRTLTAVLVDLQDTGNRWYTYAGTLRLMMKACAGVGIPIIVLDRPNPQGGVTVEGNIAENDYFSLVAPAAIPARYGLTIGELARLFNASISADLFVTIMDGWKREMLYFETGLLWRSPSPNMPHMHVPLLYSGTCLLEGTNVSEGRGTALPFEQIGAPYIKAEDLADAMNALSLPGFLFSPAWFRPVAGQYAGEPCQGVRISIDDPRRVHGFEMGIHLIWMLRQLYPREFSWRTTTDEHNAFDTLVGTGFVRAMIDSGQPAEDILAICEEQANEFQSRSAGLWIYEE